MRTRRELAVAAARLFEEMGFASTTVEDIAAAADYSASTFFRLFPRKEDAVFFDMPDRLEALRASLPPDADWPAIRAALVDHARTWEADDPDFAAARVRLFHQEPALGSRYLEYCEQYEDWLTEVVAARRGTDRGDVTTRLTAGCIVAGLRSAFKAQASTTEPDAAGSVVAHLERAFDALEAGPLTDLA
ncbi:MAG: TetR family transcriptional regulator [Actinomycetota bacterium]|nr:TetR family transcriptional regulator [Actinomycetota bacterium]